MCSYGKKWESVCMCTGKFFLVCLADFKVLQQRALTVCACACVCVCVCECVCLCVKESCVCVRQEEGDCVYV